jgi:protein TonB
MWVKHKKLILAILGSVLIHVLLLFAFAVLLELQPRAQASHPDKPIRLEIVRRPDKQPVLTAKATPPPRRGKMIDTNDMQEAEHPPEDARAESDKNTAARGELAPTGAAALPSQDGKARPVFGFDTHPSYAAADSSSGPPATVISETAPPPPQPNPEAPSPLATPPPASTPAPTPLPTAAPDEFAMLDPTPTPKPPDFDPFVRDPVTEPPKPTPVAAASKPVRSSTAEEKTLIRGDLSNRGPSSIAAVATPQGRYSKAVSDAIRVRWYARISSQMDIASFGTVKIHFSVDRRGKVIAPRVISNSGNEALAAISLQAIMDASIPPVPPEVAAAVNNTDLPLDFDFSLY